MKTAVAVLWKCVVLLFVTFALIGIKSQPAGAASGNSGKDLLDKLIANAKAEGTLNANLRPGLGPVIPDLANAFKKRFGLDIDVNLDALTTENELFAKIRAALQAGAPPSVDMLGGPDTRHIEMIEQGLATRVDNWDALLAAVNPLVASGKVKPEVVSPSPLTGYSFIWATVTKALLYNPKLIAKADLPRTRADLADAKYKGKLATAPWVDAWQYGVLYYPKDKWLEIADRVGKNAAAVLYYAASTERILLGELALADSNEYYYWQAKMKDPAAPIGVHWFSDYTSVGTVVNMLPKGSRHPAAATLFALWMTTAEAETILQRAVPYPNLVFGQSPISREIRAAVKGSGSPTVTWYDNAKTLETYKWYGTKEGRQYYGKLVRALTQRR
ncbi:MAG TPA: ABC transporter substrate-binding protein [Candidatus Binatia bacterium]